MNKKFLVFLIPLISVIAIFGIFAMFSQPIVQPTVVSQGFKPVTGAYISIIRVNGEREDLGWFHNVFTNSGKNATKDILGRQIYYGNFTFIGLCNVTGAGGCTADATDIALDNEHTSFGLNRQPGTYGDLGIGNWSIYKEFTSTSAGMRTNMTGLFNQTTGGTLLAVVEFTDSTLQNGDKLLTNWTNTAT